MGKKKKRFYVFLPAWCWNRNKSKVKIEREILTSEKIAVGNELRVCT